MKKLVFLLKNTLKFYRIIALVAIIGFSFASCNKETAIPVDPKAYEKLKAAKFAPELHDVLPEFFSNSKTSVSKTSVKSFDEDVSEIRVGDLDGSFNLFYFEYMVGVYFEAARGMINHSKDVMVSRLADPDVKANAWNYLKEEQNYFRGGTTPISPGDHYKWRFSESNGKMTVWEEIRHTNRSNDLRRTKIILHADGAAEMYQFFSVQCENCYVTISPPHFAGNNSMMYSYYKGNDFIFYTISPELPSISYIYFSEIDGKKTGKYALALSNRTIQLTDFDGNNDELSFYNYHASIYASDDVFRDCKDITIMKNGVSMTFTDSEEYDRLELSLDAQSISEIEKLFYIYPDKVFGSLYEPVGMLLNDGTELSVSDQLFEMRRAIVNFQATGALGANVRFFRDDRTFPANVFDMLPEVFDKKVAAQKFSGTNYVEKIAALSDFHNNFRISDVPDIEVKLENTVNILNTVKNLILSKNMESGF